MNVYDFDNTIYEGESGVDLFLGYLKKEPRLLAKLPMAIKCIFQYKNARGKKQKSTKFKCDRS